MTTGLLLTVIILLMAAIYIFARMRAVQMVSGDVKQLHSRPTYHGSYAAIILGAPLLALMFFWQIAEPLYLNSVIRGQMPTDVQSLSDSKSGLIEGQIRSIADGLKLLNTEERTQVSIGVVDARTALAEKGVPLGSDVQRYMVSAADKYLERQDVSRNVRMAALAVAAVLAFLYLLKALGPKLRARNLVELSIRIGLITASSIAILTTVGIVMSMLSETVRFFNMVPLSNFFLGTVWDPRFANVGSDTEIGQYGLLPLLWGTILISVIALLVAVPIGLFSAIYMSEYASPRVRGTAKPLLEILAGIPTIVYGFFALVTVGPFFRDFGATVGLDVSARSALTAGMVMGIMIIPFVSSLSDDIITAVPRAMREGSLGLGATKSETIRRVVFPAALPGIVGAVLLAASRAIGETMIVVLAAGVAPNLTANPLEAVTTVTVKIVSQLTGDTEFTSPQTLVAFALGLTLFTMTLVLNIYALYIVRKYREQYE
ncbi:MAG: phosphate ABC transporter permease subunit PstC [Hyphomicrobiales bacterium]